MEKEQLEYINKLEVRRLIFNIFDNTRILFNDYCNGKEDYSREDIQVIKGCLIDTKNMINELKEELEEVQ